MKISKYYNNFLISKFVKIKFKTRRYKTNIDDEILLLNDNINYVFCGISFLFDKIIRFKDRALV